MASGAARLPLSLVGRNIAERRLVHLLEVASSEIPLWAPYPTRRLLNVKVSPFLAFLRDAFPEGTPEERASHLDDTSAEIDLRRLD